MSDFKILLEDLDTGKRHTVDRWTSYSVTSDLFTPADSFEAQMAAIEYQRKFTAHGGQKALVFLDDALQTTAIVDERSEDVSVNSADLHITGRGVGGLLMDSAVDRQYLSLNNLTLRRVVERITSPWQPDYITSVVTNMAANRYLVAGGSKGSTKTVTLQIEYPDPNNPGKTINRGEVDYTYKVGGKGNLGPFGKASPYYKGVDQESLTQTRIQPGEKVWDVITRLCAQIGSHPYVAADGALVIMRPQYKFKSNAYGDGLQLRWDPSNHRATGGNVKGVRFETSITDRHSEIIAWGTGKPRKTAFGKELLKHTWSVKDPGPAFWTRVETPPYIGAAKLHKPDIMTVKTVRSEKIIRRLVRGTMEENAIKGFSLEYEINGHYINGALPTVDSMIRVDDDRFNLHDSFYITKVVRRVGVDSGATTTLSLIPPEIWLAVDHDSMTSNNDYHGYMAQRIFW